jgi:hypothetical protein
MPLDGSGSSPPAPSFLNSFTLHLRRSDAIAKYNDSRQFATLLFYPVDSITYACGSLRSRGRRNRTGTVSPRLLRRILLIVFAN